jgi:hypothetical protein
MPFDSLTFIGFFAIALALHPLPFSWRAKMRNRRVVGRNGEAI